MRWIGLVAVLLWVTACMPHRSINEDPYRMRLHELEGRANYLEESFKGNRRAISALRQRIEMLEKCVGK